MAEIKLNTSDAVVFLAIAMSANRMSAIIVFGDHLGIIILSAEEIESAINQLVRIDFITIKNDIFSLSKRGKRFYNTVKSWWYPRKALEKMISYIAENSFEVLTNDLGYVIDRNKYQKALLEYQAASARFMTRQRERKK